MEESLKNKIVENVEGTCKKKVYEKPVTEEHKPLEESTAYVYYYYR